MKTQSLIRNMQGHDSVYAENTVVILYWSEWFSGAVYFHSKPQ